MAKTVIITDSDSSLPEEICTNHNIIQVPISIHFGENTYQTGIDINDQQLFEIIDREKKIPTTSAPSPQDFINAFQKAFDQGAQTIVCFCVSSEISATYQSALNAAEEFEGKDIHIVDSRTLSLAQGFMVLTAAEAAAAGQAVPQIIESAQKTGENVFVYGALPTLKYLAMGGRVGKLAAGMADTLNIKPILTTQNGKLELLEKVRTQKKAIFRVMDLVEKRLNGRKMKRVAVIHVNAPQEAEKLLEDICERINCPANRFIAEFTAGLSVHAGAGLLGIVVETEE